MENFEFQIWCSCGQILLSEVGDGFVVMPDQKRVWLRRKSDAVRCESCARKYQLAELQESVNLGQSLPNP